MSSGNARLDLSSTRNNPKPRSRLSLSWNLNSTATDINERGSSEGFLQVCDREA